MEELRLQEKVRVYALARELNIESKDLLDMCKKAGFDVKNQLSSLEPEQRDAIVELIKKGSHKQAPASPAKPAPGPVLSVGSKVPTLAPTRPKAEPPRVAPPPAPAAVVPAPVSPPVAPPAPVEVPAAARLAQTPAPPPPQVAPPAPAPMVEARPAPTAPAP